MAQPTISSLSLQATAAERIDQGVALAEIKPAEAIIRKHTNCSLKAIVHRNAFVLEEIRGPLRLIVIDCSINWRHMIDK